MANSGTYILYIVSNTINGKRYIGITHRSLDVRMREHFRHARYKVNNGHFYRAIRKYGNKCFLYSELSRHDSADKVKLAEINAISLLKPEYNSTLGGDGRCAPHSEETKLKLKIAKLNNPTRYWLGKTRSKETIDKIVESKRGKPVNPKCIESLRKVHNVAITKSSEVRKKPVICLNDGLVFDCAMDASIHYNIPRNSVYKSLHRNSYTNGLKFYYEYNL